RTGPSRSLSQILFTAVAVFVSAWRWGGGANMQGRHTAQAAKLLCGLFLCLSVGGCAFGPRALERTHGQYNDAVRRVYEEQLLASLVHLRYTENPTQLDVSAIAAQYELSSQAEARPFFLSPNPSNSNVIFKTFTSILPDVLIGANNRP